MWADLRGEIEEMFDALEGCAAPSSSGAPSDFMRGFHIGRADQIGGTAGRTRKTKKYQDPEKKRLRERRYRQSHLERERERKRAWRMRKQAKEKAA